MLWSALYLTFTLTCFYGFNTGKTCLAVLLSFLGIIAGNALRSAALFYPEAHILALPSWAHEGIGMVVFFFTAIFIVGGIQWIRKNFHPDPSHLYHFLWVSRHSTPGSCYS